MPASSRTATIASGPAAVPPNSGGCVILKMPASFDAAIAGAARIVSSPVCRHLPRRKVAVTFQVQTDLQALLKTVCVLGDFLARASSLPSSICWMMEALHI